MDKAITEFAKMFKDRDNPNVLGLQLGEVISPLPDIKIKIDDAILLDQSHLVISSQIYINYKNIDDTYLNAGDKVILIPMGNEQFFYLADKVV